MDQGESYGFLGEQLQPKVLETAEQKRGWALTLRMQPGYDHSYYFIASFIRAVATVAFLYNIDGFVHGEAKECLLSYGPPFI